jgi:hypothetical protein
VQDSEGRFSLVEGSGPIHRLSSNSLLPGLPTWQWTC